MTRQGANRGSPGPWFSGPRNGNAFGSIATEKRRGQGWRGESVWAESRWERTLSYGLTGSFVREVGKLLFTPPPAGALTESTAGMIAARLAMP